MSQPQNIGDVIETRRRSRSKTPGTMNLRVSSDRELNGSETSPGRKVRKAPTVGMIEEEAAPSPVVAASQGRSTPVRKTRVVTSDYSSEDVSPDRARQAATAVAANAQLAKSMGQLTQSSVTTTTTTMTSTEQTTNAAQKMAPAKVILTPEELQQHAAYKEYLEAGEYWNKYPKTDYTYSELSPHRREVAPGLVAMPNMSRPSLNKHAERVQTMIQRNPEQEAFIRERYTSARSRLVRSNPYDSHDETDELMQSSKSIGVHRQQRVTIEQRSIVSRTSEVRGWERGRLKLFEAEMLTVSLFVLGFFSRVYGFVTSFFVNVFKRIYLLISSVLFLDAWLLQTSAANAEQQKIGQKKRRFLLFLLVLLPLLLIGGTLLYLDPSALDTIRASLPSEFPDLPELKLPNLPSLPSLPSLPELPEMPSVPLPDVESVKQYVGDRWTDLSDLTGTYFDQLKLASQNSVDAVRELWGAGGAEEEPSA
ncbi:AGAP007310-PA [Anopheles gambiae str. PEST]|uniref:AGAP007310-PA n=1 Tax=Anopheles gambiae TaxID=7165 RepID=Q7QJ61_ANOGA|nr:AGAP007310-PA [Anopheles gambiae str. PEST]